MARAGTMAMSTIFDEILLGDYERLIVLMKKLQDGACLHRFLIVVIRGMLSWWWGDRHVLWKHLNLVSLPKSMTKRQSLILVSKVSHFNPGIGRLAVWINIIFRCPKFHVVVLNGIQVKRDYKQVCLVYSEPWRRNIILF